MVLPRFFRTSPMQHKNPGLKSSGTSATSRAMFAHICSMFDFRNWISLNMLLKIILSRNVPGEGWRSRDERPWSCHGFGCDILPAVCQMNSMECRVSPVSLDSICCVFPLQFLGSGKEAASSRSAAFSRCCLPVNLGPVDSFCTGHSRSPLRAILRSCP